MAYIPDEAILDYGEISLRAFHLYCYYCKHGSMRKNKITVSLRRAAKDLKMDFSNVAKYNRELRDEGWISENPVSYEITLLKGFRVVKSTTPEEASSVVKTTSENGKNYHPHIIGNNNQPFNQPKEKAAALKKTAAAFHKLPEDFEITPDMREWAQNFLPEIIPEIESATESWKSHYLSVSGDKGYSSDWIEVWKKGMRNHLRHVAKFNGGNNGSAKTNGHAAAGSGASRGFDRKQPQNNSGSTSRLKKLKYSSEV